MQGHAQTSGYVAPDGLSMATKEDCRRNKSEFLKATDYLLQAPIDAVDRKAANAVALMWMINTDEVSLNLNTDVVPMISQAPEDSAVAPTLMMLYMVGWSRYILATGDKSELAGNLAGYRAVLKYYLDPLHGMTTNEKLDHYAKLQKDGKLEEAVGLLYKKANAEKKN